jgi:predicted glycosyltransferase involved in capsule biosynthesis
MECTVYALYIERVEAGLKSNPRCFFKFANLKRNSSSYPSTMLLGDACARNAKEIADWFNKYFQGVYVKDNSQKGFVVDGAAVLKFFPLFC